MPNSRPTMAPHHEESDITDDKSLAVGRKRRISTGLADPVNTSRVQQTEGPRQAPKTPAKPKKRVRFSDPGPETSTASSSTGLTPYLSRASFEPRARETSPSRPSPPRPRPLAKTPKRFSLPTHLSTSLPSPSLPPPPVPISGEVQFAPLHQILDPRLKRRLRRNHLSEEINDIDAEKRSEAQSRQEIKNLREQLAFAKESAKERSDGAEGNAPSSERIQQLEQELDELKRERSMTAESRSGGPETQESPRPDIEELVDDGSNAPASSGTGTQEHLTSEIEIYVDDDSDGVLIALDSDSDGILGDVKPVQASASTSVNEAATQTSLPSPHAETLRAARISLEYLFPGEIALGLIPEDPKPLFDVMLERMQTLKAQTFVAEDTISRTQTQESNLRNQFNAVLEQLDRARKHAEGISTRTSNEKARADSSQARVEMLETSLQAATAKVNELEKDADEKDRSIQKLQDALDTYRVEVGKLELLIARMEGDHNTAMSSLRAEMDEAVADLECHVAAETTGRREAEQEVDEKNERIKQLKVQEQELKNALNEKQQIIRETEKIFEEERVGREREVGGLNVRIGQLSSDLSESNTKVTNAEQKEQILMQNLQEEREAGLRAVEAVQAELARAVNKSEDIKTAHVSDVQRRGAEVTQHQGLLTPVSACRFKDVEGYVEVRRGRSQGRNRDSGVVIREEDEDEDMIMADDM